jgi:hypothetical protein
MKRSRRARRRTARAIDVEMILPNTEMATTSIRDMKLRRTKTCNRCVDVQATYVNRASTSLVLIYYCTSFGYNVYNIGVRLLVQLKTTKE